MSLGRSGKYLVALLACVAFGAAQAQPAASAEPKFKWLCKPGRANDPCQTSLRTETVSKDESLGFSTPKALTRLRNKVDCFYVYPTVSSQPGPNADLTEGPEISGIAEQQAARFAPGCRMFAPIYRQYTIAAIFGSQITQEVSEIAYGSVKAAWNEYLKKYNKGRGIVLIGHSQGTGHLEQLISETFDRKPNLRKRLVSAVLIGGNVIVRKGKRTGGSFNRVPALHEVNGARLRHRLLQLPQGSSAGGSTVRTPRWCARRPRLRPGNPRGHVRKPGPSGRIEGSAQASLQHGALPGSVWTSAAKPDRIRGSMGQFSEPLQRHMPQSRWGQLA